MYTKAEIKEFTIEAEPCIRCPFPEPGCPPFKDGLTA